VRFLRAHGVSIVATVWLLLLIVGVGVIVATAAVMPPGLLALRYYISELRERIREGTR
jgi:hypothetical protein